MAAEYSTGLPKLTLKITSEKEVTIDFIVKEADVIWKEMKACNSDDVVNILQAKHPEFYKAYPIVFRYICQIKQYSSKAFRLWLGKIKQNPWKTEMEYLDAQADYATILYKIKNPRANATAASNVRQNIRAGLQAEHDDFKQRVATFTEQVASEEAKFLEKNMAELREFAQRAGVSGMSTAETIRFISDLNPEPKLNIVDHFHDCSYVPPAPIEFSADELMS
jgi:hypothetical protein